jgi:hypothetical protein
MIKITIKDIMGTEFNNGLEPFFSSSLNKLRFNSMVAVCKQRITMLTKRNAVRLANSEGLERLHSTDCGYEVHRRLLERTWNGDF